MKKNEHINQLVDETMNSVDHIKRAGPRPFLLTRINARLPEAKESIWEKAVWFIGRPAIAIPSMALLILINIAVIVLNSPDALPVVTDQSAQAAPDELSYTVASIYDIENTEP